MSNIHKRIAGHIHELKVLNIEGQKLSCKLEKLKKKAEFHKEAIKNLEKKLPKTDVTRL